MKIDLSLKEAAAIADIPERSARKAIEKKTVQPLTTSAGLAPRYRFSAHDVLYLKLITNFPFALPTEDKQALQDLVKLKSQASGRWHRSNGNLIVKTSDVELLVELKPMRSFIAHRLRVFRRGRRRIISNPDILSGEPVFRGTRIPLAHIAGLFTKRVNLDEIREDYPSLSAEDLEFAALVARITPEPGRRRKPLVLIRGGETVETKDRYVDRLETSTR